MGINIGIHCFLSPFLNETRLFKEAEELLSSKIFGTVYAVGIWEDGLKKVEIHKSGLILIRVVTLSKKYSSRISKSKRITKSICAYLSLIQFMIAILSISWRKRSSHITCHNALLLPVSALVKFLFKTKIIYAPHELESQRNGVSKGLNKLSYTIERNFIKSCENIVVVCDPIAQWYKREFRVNNVYIVRALPINDGHNYGKEILNNHKQLLRSKLEIGVDDTVFIYQGLISKSRGVEYLIDAFHDMSNNKILLLMGYGELFDEISQQNYSNIKCKSAVPYNEIIKNTSIADVGLFVIPGDVSKSYRYSLPNKFFEYIHSYIPVIVSSNLEYLSEIVLENDIGWVINARDVCAIISNLSSTEIIQKRSKVIEYAHNNRWVNEKHKYKDIYN